MPWGDRTGPMGRGPMTGRGAGYCAGYNVPGFANNAPGMGRGLGRGRGFGRARGFWRGQFEPVQVPVQQAYGYPVQPVRLTKDQQSEILEAEKKDLEAELDEIQKEIKQISKNIEELRKKQIK